MKTMRDLAKYMYDNEISISDLEDEMADIIEEQKKEEERESIEKELRLDAINAISDYLEFLEKDEKEIENWISYFEYTLSKTVKTAKMSFDSKEVESYVNDFYKMLKKYW